MKIARWGNSLAVRLPRDVTEELSLREGDDIELRAAGDNCFEVVRDRRREEALKRIREMSWRVPPGFKFNRDEIYDRFGPDAPGRVPYDDDA
jgi:antitoxin MazE